MRRKTFKTLASKLKIAHYRNITTPTLNKEAVYCTEDIECGSRFVLENLVCFSISIFLFVK